MPYVEDQLTRIDYLPVFEDMSDRVEIRLQSSPLSLPRDVKLALRNRSFIGGCSI